MFSLDSLHLILAGTGAAILLAYWLPRLVSGREPTAAPLLIGLGFGLTLLLPEPPPQLDPTAAPILWERAAELAVTVALFGTGLRFDRLVPRRNLVPTLRLLLVAMPLTIAGVALMGWAVGLPLAGAVLLGAVLAPTDPVLAGDVQVGPPQEGDEQPVRFTLTAEAGLNDGLAFPFVYFALALAAAGSAGEDWSWLGEWVLRDVLYRIAIGALCGAALGWLLGRLLFAVPRGNTLADTVSGVLGFAGVLLVYGATELAEGYGFIACFVAGVALRRVEAEHDFHRRLHDFSQSIEHALTALLLVALGGALAVLWPWARWQDWALAAGLVFLLRPLAAWVSLAGTVLRGHERKVVAFYGVRGIGSIYYLAFAATHDTEFDIPQLWGTVAAVIVLSTLVHGLSAGAAVEKAVARGNDTTADPRV